MNKRGNDVKMQ